MPGLFLKKKINFYCEIKHPNQKMLKDMYDTLMYHKADTLTNNLVKK